MCVCETRVLTWVQRWLQPGKALHGTVSIASFGCLWLKPGKTTKIAKKIHCLPLGKKWSQIAMQVHQWVLTKRYQEVWKRVRKQKISNHSSIRLLTDSQQLLIQNNKPLSVMCPRTTSHKREVLTSDDTTEWHLKIPGCLDGWPLKSYYIIFLQHLPINIYIFTLIYINQIISHYTVHHYHV